MLFRTRACASRCFRLAIMQNKAASRLEDSRPLQTLAGENDYTSACEYLVAVTASMVSLADGFSHFCINQARELYHKSVSCQHERGGIGER